MLKITVLAILSAFLLNVYPQAIVAGSLSPQGAIIPIANEELTYNEPRLGAFSLVGRRFFVAWKHEISAGDGYNYYSNVQGRFIEPNGKLSPAKGYSFPLNLHHYVDHLIGGYNSILDNYLLLWNEGYDGNGGTYSRIVNPNGTLGVRNRVVRAAGPFLYSLAFSTFTNQFLYAAFSSEEVISLQLLDPTGRKIGNPSFIGQKGLAPIALLPDPEAPGYFLILQRGVREIYFQHLSSSGTPIGTAVKLVTEDHDTSVLSAIYNQATRQFLILTSGPFNKLGRFRVRSFLVDRNGHLLRSPKYIGPLIAGGFAATATWSGYVIGYDRGGLAWVRLLDTRGFPVGEEVRLTPTIGNYIVTNIIYAQPLKKCLVVWISSGRGYKEIYGRFVRLVP